MIEVMDWGAGALLVLSLCSFALAGIGKLCIAVIEQ